MFTITINGDDVSALVRQRQMRIEAALTNATDATTFPLVSPDNMYVPVEGSDVGILDHLGNQVFGGILNTTTDFAAGKGLGYDCECVDFSVELDRRLLVESYADTTAGAIVRDWVAKVNEFMPADRKFTVNGVQDGPAVGALKVNYLPFSLAMEKLHRLSGYEWYVGYDRDVKFFSQESLPAPIPLRPRELWEQSGEWMNLRIRRGPVSQIRTRVYVRGATYEGQETISRYAGDGQTRTFFIGYLARGVKVYVNAVGPKLLGLDNITSAKQWYFNYEGMFVRQDDSEPVLGSADELEVLFTPLIPVRVVVSDEDLVARYGIREHVVQDQSIDTKELARLRGKLELRGQAISGQFQSLVTGWRPGQVILINLPERRLQNVNGLVYKTSLAYAGNLDRYLTAVQFEVI